MEIGLDPNNSVIKRWWCTVFIPVLKYFGSYRLEGKLENYIYLGDNCL